MNLDRAFELIVIPGSVVFDIGSFRGDLAGRLAVLTGREGVVYAFEPHPIHFFHLSALAAMAWNQHGLKIAPYCKAMSDNVGHTILHISQFVESPDFNQASSVLPELGNVGRLGEGMIQLKVESDTIDNYCRSTFAVPSFIKIDTEGADGRVVAGGAKVIEHYRPAVIMEFGYDPRQNLSTNNVEHLKLLENIGYEIFVVDVMRYKDIETTPGSRYSSEQIFRFGSADAQALSGPLLGDLIALPRKSPGFDASPIRNYIAPRSALQLLDS